MDKSHPDIKQLAKWVKESELASQEERAERWRDEEVYDGNQWTSEDYEKALDFGITPLTVNRTFPAVNMILGMYANNRKDITAKGRTQKDSELAQVVTESLQFVMDQCDGHFHLTRAFKDAIVPGFGCIQEIIDPDPRREGIAFDYRDWKEIWWDAYSSPWFDPKTCRYVFLRRWTDVESLQALFPEKKKDIEQQHQDLLSGESRSGLFYGDYATEVEDERSINSGGWAHSDRKRVRPVEMWYRVYEKKWFAKFYDGRVLEIDPEADYNEQYNIVESAAEVVSAVVPKMYTSTFLGDLLLYRGPSHHHHDEFPFIPFVGYMDRYGYPYGIPRQIRDQDIEVNKRRSMALALLNSRGAVAERGVAKDEAGLQQIWEEINSLNPLVIVEDGKLGAIQIINQDSLAPSQIGLLEQSEREIQQISGATDEMMGYYSNARASTAIEARKESGMNITAQLFDNFKRSMKRLGEVLLADMQGTWTQEKVLRVTDRLTGIEKFTVVNETVMRGDGRPVVLNDITQGKYDVVVTDAPMTDTTREKYMEMLIEWTKRVDPSMAPHLLGIALEMSNLPNKERILAKMRPLLGMSPDEEDMTPEQIREKARQDAEQQAQIQETMQQMSMRKEQLDMAKTEAEIQKILADVERSRIDAQNNMLKAQAVDKRMELEAMKYGYQAEAGTLGGKG